MCVILIYFNCTVYKHELYTSFTIKYIQIDMKIIMNGCDMNDIINIYFNYFFALCFKIAKSICNANSSNKKL